MAFTVTPENLSAVTGRLKRPHAMPKQDHINISRRGTSAILAGLRLLQQQQDTLCADPDIDASDARILDILTGAGEYQALRSEEIDALCERINTGRDLDPKPRTKPLHATSRTEIRQEALSVLRKAKAHVSEARAQIAESMSAAAPYLMGDNAMLFSDPLTKIQLSIDRFDRDSFEIIDDEIWTREV